LGEEKEHNFIKIPRLRSLVLQIIKKIIVPVLN
jgi:hypothetical protein